MLLRCSEEFMYALNNASGSSAGPCPTFSPYDVQSGLPCVSSWWRRSGLCESDCVESRCAVHAAPPLGGAGGMVSEPRPFCSRAWLPSCPSREAYDVDVQDAACAEG